jgi:hypothetical protein
MDSGANIHVWIIEEEPAIISSVSVQACLTVLQCYIVTVSQCYSVPVSQCYSVTVIHCYSVTMVWIIEEEPAIISSVSV